MVGGFFLGGAGRAGTLLLLTLVEDRYRYRRLMVRAVRVVDRQGRVNRLRLNADDVVHRTAEFLHSLVEVVKDFRHADASSLRRSKFHFKALSVGPNESPSGNGSVVLLGVQPPFFGCSVSVSCYLA